MYQFTDKCKWHGAPMGNYVGLFIYVVEGIMERLIVIAKKGS